MNNVTTHKEIIETAPIGRRLIVDGRECEVTGYSTLRSLGCMALVLHDCDLDDLSNRVIEIAEFEPCVSSSDLKTREFTLTERGQEILSVERPARVPELEVPTAVKNLALRRVLDRTAEAEGLDEAERLDWIDRTFREELEQLVERLESRRSELFSIESAS